MLGRVTTSYDLPPHYLPQESFLGSPTHLKYLERIGFMSCCSCPRTTDLVYTHMPDVWDWSKIIFRALYKNALSAREQLF